MAKRIQAKVNLDPKIAEILDAVAQEIGSDELTPRPSRSDLLNKAALLYIKRARKRKRLRRVIQLVESKYSVELARKLKVLKPPVRAQG
jgi:hypothetical protein